MKKAALSQALFEYTAQSFSSLKIPQLGRCDDSRLNEETLYHALRPTFKTLSSQLSWVAKLDRRIRQISKGRTWLQMGDPTDYLKDCEAGNLLTDKAAKGLRKSSLFLEATDGKQNLKFIIIPMHVVAPGFGPFFNEKLREPD